MRRRSTVSWRAFRRAPRSSGDDDIQAIHSATATKRDEFNFKLLTLLLNQWVEQAAASRASRPKR
jgi:predicted site-specific integrase-resolvase